MARQATGKAVEKPPVGTHLARCIGVSLCGFKKKKGYQGGPDRIQSDCVITWELPNAKKKDGTAFEVSAFLNFTLNGQSELKKIIQGWFSTTLTDEQCKKGIPLDKVVGRCCQVIVAKDDKSEFVGVESVCAWPKGFPEIPAVYPQWYFDLECPADCKGTPPPWVWNHVRKGVNEDGSPWKWKQGQAPVPAKTATSSAGKNPDDFPFGANADGSPAEAPDVDFEDKAPMPF